DERPARARETPSACQIILINRFFHPDHSATSQLLSDLAFHLAGAGRSVQVITSRQRHDNSDTQLPPRETIRGVEVHRVATTGVGGSGLLGRGFDYLSFYVAASRLAMRLANRGDIVVAKTDPPMLSLPAMYAARRRGLRLVNWLQDLYPEVAAQ